MDLLLLPRCPNGSSRRLFNRYGWRRQCIRKPRRQRRALHSRHPGRTGAHRHLSCTLFLSRARRLTTAASWSSRTPLASRAVKLAAGDMVHVPRNQCSSRRASDTRPARGELLLGREHGSQRRATAHAPTKWIGAPDAPAQHGSAKTTPAVIGLDRACTTTCCAWGRCLSGPHTAMQSKGPEL